MYISKIFVTVDIVLIRRSGFFIEILLIKRLNDPFKDCWALPGGFVDENEGLETAAKRELFEETSVIVNQVFQIGAYGEPKRDPRSHIISIAFFSETDLYTKAIAADDAKEVKWFKIDDLPSLAFDHLKIINDAIIKFQF